MIISSIPTDCEDSPKRIIVCVVSVLRTSDLSSEIKNIRVIDYNSAKTNNRKQFFNCVKPSTSSYKATIVNDSAGTICKTTAVIVSFKSEVARTHLIKNEHIKRDLTINEFFFSHLPFTIYLFKPELELKNCSTSTHRQEMGKFL